MSRCSMLAFLGVALFSCLVDAAQLDAPKPPIQALTAARPTGDIYRAVKRTMPLVLKTADQAAEHFDGENLAALEKAVDFEKQIVLVFAWAGSGRDKLEYTIAESFPEQITFKIHPGGTRDLRGHLKVFALRSNVKWSLAE